jgi:hypothetical protein
VPLDRRANGTAWAERVTQDHQLLLDLQSRRPDTRAITSIRPVLRPLIRRSYDRSYPPRLVPTHRAPARAPSITASPPPARWPSDHAYGIMRAPGYCI